MPRFMPRAPGASGYGPHPRRNRRFSWPWWRPSRWETWKLDVHTGSPHCSACGSQDRGSGRLPRTRQRGAWSRSRSASFTTRSKKMKRTSPAGRKCGRDRGRARWRSGTSARCHSSGKDRSRKRQLPAAAGPGCGPRRPPAATGHWTVFGRTPGQVAPGVASTLSAQSTASHHLDGRVRPCPPPPPGPRPAAVRWRPGRGPA